MKILDNINSLLGEDLKASLDASSKIKIAASCFSIYAYEALKNEFSKIDSLEFIFTAPTFIPNVSSQMKSPIKYAKNTESFLSPKLAAKVRFMDQTLKSISGTS